MWGGGERRLFTFQKRRVAGCDTATDRKMRSQAGFARFVASLSLLLFSLSSPLLVQDWVHGKRHGQGTYTYADGSVYTGLCSVRHSFFPFVSSTHNSALSHPCRAMGQRQDPWEGRVALPQRKQIQVSWKNGWRRRKESMRGKAKREKERGKWV